MSLLAHTGVASKWPWTSGPIWQYDKKHRQVEYKIGEKVKVYTPKRVVDKRDKLMLNCYRPFEIIKKKSDLNYVIKNGNGKRDKTQTVHVKRMQPYHEPWSD